MKTVIILDLRTIARTADLIWKIAMSVVICWLYKKEFER